MRYDADTLWQENKDAVYTFIRKRVSDENDTKDILQNVMIRIWKYFEKDREEIKNIKAWIYQVSKNSISDFYRRRKTFAPHNENLDIADEAPADAYADAALFLEPLIDLLPPDYSVPLKMSEIEGLKQELVARKLNMSHGAVRTKISRARGMLKKKIEECTVTEKDAAGQLMSFRIKTDCGSLQRTLKSYRNFKTCPNCLYAK